MKPAFWLCLLLVVASGLSAYIGNEWGRKIGKRKLSIFSMRPKHSSTFLTVLLSMCLSLGLMGVLFVFSPQLQQQLFLPNENNSSTLQAYEHALASANQRIEALRRQQQPLQVAQAPIVTPASPIFVPSRAPQEPSPTKSVFSTPLPIQSRFSAPPLVVAVSSSSPVPLPPTKESVAIARHTPSRLQARRIKPNASVIEAPQAEPTEVPPNYPMGSLFQLTLNGDLDVNESRQVSQGLQTLTQDYLQLLGVQANALNWKSAQLQAEVLKLSTTGQYRLNVSLQPAIEKKIPVTFQVTRLSDSTSETDFDPQLLLEEQRLQSSVQKGGLPQDLQAVLKKHASQQKIALQMPPSQDIVVRSAQLPFEIINFKSNGNVLTGELFLRTP